MVQKKLPLINSAHGSETRNIINELIKLFNGMGYTYAEALQKANNVLSEAKKTNDMNKAVDKRLDNIIAGSGTSSTEVVDARGEHTVLGGRLSANEQKLINAAKFDMESDTYNRAIPVSPKAIYNQGGVVMVVSKKPHGNGFLRFKLRDNQYTTSVSIGAPAELMRVIEVLEVDECFSFLHAESGVKDSTNWQTLDVNYTKVGIGQQSLPVRSTINKVAGEWIEYQVDLPRGINEVVALVYKTSGSSTSVDISVDGSTVITGEDFSGNGFERVVVPVSRSGQHTIRFTTSIAGRFNIAGVNVVDIENYMSGYQYDTLLSLVKTASDHYVTSNGAMEYALLDSDTGLWCGSYHGGETRLSLKYILDGRAVAVNDGDLKIGNVIEVEQETDINGKLTAYSTQRFEGDGSVEHETVFDGNINLETLFTNMTTALDTFDEVLYPVRSDMSAMVSGDRIYLPEGVNYVVQRNPSTLQKVTTLMNSKKMPVDSQIIPYIRKTDGAYNKVYSANIQSPEGVNFTGGHFKTVHIFE